MSTGLNAASPGLGCQPSTPSAAFTAGNRLPAAHRPARLKPVCCSSPYCWNKRPNCRADLAGEACQRRASCSHGAGAALPTHTEVGALICGSSACLPGPSCSCLLYIFVLLSNSPPELEELDQINSGFDKHIHGPAKKETSALLSQYLSQGNASHFEGAAPIICLHPRKGWGDYLPEE